jgi:hypothetical protein
VIEKKEGLIMLEKAKNRKIFYFFILVILGLAIIVIPVMGYTEYMSNNPTNGVGVSYDLKEWHTNFTYTGTDLALIHWIPYSGTLSYSGCGSGPITFTVKWNTVTKGTASAWIDSNTMWIDFENTDFSGCTGTGSIELSGNCYIRNGGTTRSNAPSNANVPHSHTTVYEAGTTYSYFGASYNIGLTASVSNGNLPLEVTFTDASTGYPESAPYADYLLSFGDGSYWSGEWQYEGENWFHTYYYEGTYNYSYMIDYDGDIQYSNGTITVSDTSSNYEVTVHGLNTAPIEGANVSIWYNGEYQDSEGSSSIGTAYFTIPPYRFVNGTVTKSGYQTAYFDTYIYPDDNYETVTLYLDNETLGSGDSYGNYIVTFKNAVTGENVGYSNIEVYSDSGYTTLFYDEYSNSGGVWTGLLPMDTVYYYKYPETAGYYSQSWSYNLTSSPAYKTVNLVPKSAATSTVTPTPTVTVTTITPTVTYTYNDSNLSTLNVKERFTNLLVLAGFQNAESADLIFAMIIVLGCTALIGWITLSGSGAGMGAIIGFVFALGLGLIPLWLLISAVFLGSLYVALKLFGGSEE